MKIICVSGSVGVGKTTYAKKLAKELNFKYIDVNEIINDNDLVIKYDKELDTKVINLEKLKEILVKIIKESVEGLVVDSHLSHFLDKELVDEVHVLKLDVKTLRKRLEERGYNEKKIKENLEAEIMDVCLIEARELGHNVKIVE